MTANTEKLGGRLALLDPQALSAAQKEIYDRISNTFGSWADRIHFQSKTEDGRLIGPFNPILASRAARSGRPIECRSTTRRPLTRPNGQVSSRNTINTIMWAPAGRDVPDQRIRSRQCEIHAPHRTETMDYVIQLSGELDCELDSGDVVHLKPGDVMVQRGTIHTWVNRGSVPAVIAFILIDATPDEVNGKEMRTVYPPREAAPPPKNRLLAPEGGTHLRRQPC